MDPDDRTEDPAVPGRRLERSTQRRRSDVGPDPEFASDDQHGPPTGQCRPLPGRGQPGTGEAEQRRVLRVEEPGLPTLELDPDPGAPGQLHPEQPRQPDEPHPDQGRLEDVRDLAPRDVGDEQGLPVGGETVDPDRSTRAVHTTPVRRGRATLASPRAGGAAVTVRLLAVDGSSLAHRAWHSTRGDAVGPDLDVVLAAIGSMLASTWRYGPYDVALIALDHPENRRRDLFPSYKAQRPATDPDLRAVLAALPDALATAGVPVRREAGAEADDLLAAAADDADRRGWRTDLLSSDRDLTALVGPRVRLLRPRRRFSDLAVEDVAAVMAAHGVPPHRYRDLAAMRGDPSDGLEGAPGIGAATAARLLAAHDDVAGIYRALPDLPPRTAEALRRGREAVERNLLLMAPLPHLDADLDGAVAAGAPLTGLATALAERGATAAAGRLRRALDPGAASGRAPAPAPPPPPMPPPPEDPSGTVRTRAGRARSSDRD